MQPVCVDIQDGIVVVEMVEVKREIVLEEKRKTIQPCSIAELGCSSNTRICRVRVATTRGERKMRVWEIACVVGRRRDETSE